MNLPLKTIVIIVIVALVLVIISIFFLGSSGESVTRAQAENTFNTMCASYSQRDCEWKVTYEDGFQNYLAACRFLYGNHKDSYSCIHIHCALCNEATEPQLKCASLCNICAGHDAVGIEREACCTRYNAQCFDSGFDCTETC